MWGKEQGQKKGEVLLAESKSRLVNNVVLNCKHMGKLSETEGMLLPTSSSLDGLILVEIITIVLI